ETVGAAAFDEAAKLLRENEFDCVTLDLSLGERAGVEVLHVLSVIKSQAPIIIISGAEHTVCEETLKIGKSLNLNLCTPVPKPVDLSALRESLLPRLLATHQLQMKPRRSLSLRALGLGSLALICTIIGSNVIFLSNLRESSLQTAEANLARYSLMLVEEADRSFKSVDLVLSSVGDYLGRREVTDSESYQRIMSDQATHLLLKEKITGLPQIDAVTMINAQGKLINFSRYWPIPDVNVADRDYFKALKADPNLETFISAPVQNRGSGTWNIYIARRLNDPNGEFMGLLLGAMSLQYFENYFASTSLGVGSSVSLVREEGTRLAS